VDRSGFGDESAEHSNSGNKGQEDNAFFSFHVKVMLFCGASGRNLGKLVRSVWLVGGVA